MAANVNVAAICVGTRNLGPGWRSAVWVQGCPLRCPECLAPEWIPDRVANLVPAGDLAAELIADPAVDGLTFSGGEPMMQAAGLAEVAREVRRARDVSLICFTGFTLRRLKERPPSAGVADLLSEVDVLVDGPYLAVRNDGRGLRGSTNQQVRHLTDRLAEGFDFEHGPRTAEVRVGGDDEFVELMLVGVPPHGMAATVGEISRRIERENGR
ncbi:anaerobic ribonucleoside-triphosphate reductase activating protein [Lentzea waywayandensis]|uniref:Anaerobic ribonucleoside-triphosphate reductase activating protein n=1 Tax=Lentzea waywayandensis TaxID=84724 RepID=A0A1I6DH80_9PSEU|nr:4Fe-4S single cluster domain-containing protein [Lentzea waywayandensis]SFR04799.1 anaerobic ribonucleoside-triphosphate reductase activating protein [Lentzea waywayandensis]